MSGIFGYTLYRHKLLQYVIQYVILYIANVII